MDRPNLVVDIGTYETSVALVTGGRVRLLPCPASGAARWPSAAALDGDRVVVGAAAQRMRDAAPGRYVAGVRAVVDTGGDGRALLAHYLAAVREEAVRRGGAAPERLTLAVPMGYGPSDPRRAVLRDAAADAGFPDAELVGDAVAAAEDVRAEARPADGALVLVCDLGLQWTVTLARFDAGGAVPLGSDTAAGFDPLLAQNLRAGQEVDEHRALELARQVKHRLAEVDEATGRLAPGAPPYRLTRAGLARLAEPALRWLLAGARAVVARAGCAMGDVAVVALVGGGARLPFAAAVLREHLGRPVVVPDEPELSVVRGAARWAALGGPRSVPAAAPAWRLEPVGWPVPDGTMTLARWLVAEGQPYRTGDPLARARTTEGRVVDLTAVRDGVLVEHRLHAGDALGRSVVAGVARPPAGDGRPARVHRLSATGGFLLTPDRDRVAAWPEGGTSVAVRPVDGAAAGTEMRPARDGEFTGRVHVSPERRLALVTWDGDGQFAVWDVPTGDLVVKFAAGARPERVRVDERSWRLVAELDRTVRVGRYRHGVATVWDLATGEAVEEVVEPDPLRRFPAYAARSARDGFGVRAAAGDDLTAHAVRLDADAAVLLRRDGVENVHVRLSGVDDLRVAFDADARHLLATWTGAGGAHLDLWKL